MTVADWIENSYRGGDSRRRSSSSLHEAQLANIFLSWDQCHFPTKHQSTFLRVFYWTCG